MFVHLYIRIFAIFCARDGVLSVLGRKGCSPPHIPRFVLMVMMSGARDRAAASAAAAASCAVEMDADEAREAADEQSSAANEAAAQLAAERRSRAAEVNARVSARSDSARERARESVAADTARDAKRLRTEKAVNAILGAFRCRPPPSHLTSPPSPTIPSKPPRSSSPGTTMLGQSPLTRAHCGGGGACSLARSRALVVAVTFCSVRLHRPSRTYARARVRHQRASRASSPFFVPPPRTHARAATALACSLARSRARARAVRLRCGRSHRPSRALRAPRVTRALAYVITAHRARHRRFPSPRARPARAPCSGGGAHSRTLDCARAVWRW